MKSNISVFSPGKALLGNAADFTVLIKNQIEFPKFDIRRYVKYMSLCNTYIAQ